MDMKNGRVSQLWDANGPPVCDRPTRCGTTVRTLLLRAHTRFLKVVSRKVLQSRRSKGAARPFPPSENTLTSQPAKRGNSEMRPASTVLCPLLQAASLSAKQHRFRSSCVGLLTPLGRRLVVCRCPALASSKKRLLETTSIFFTPLGNPWNPGYVAGNRIHSCSSLSKLSFYSIDRKTAQ